jgi:hypothetical protein
VSGVLINGGILAEYWPCATASAQKQDRASRKIAARVMVASIQISRVSSSQAG